MAGAARTAGVELAALELEQELGVPGNWPGNRQLARAQEGTSSKGNIFDI